MQQTVIVPQRPQARAGIERIEAYVPGSTKVGAGMRAIKLSSNESPLGASPAAVAALAGIGGNLALYPDGTAKKLRDAIAHRYGLDSARIVCGAGSDELLTMLAHAYAGPGDEGIITQYGFLVYKIALLASGATPVVAPEVDCVVNVDAILACVTPRTKIVFIANPGNPTGSFLPYAEVSRLARALPSHVLLVLDAAYCEYVTRNDYAAGVELVSQAHNVVMTRTFSKIHGLAALRIGWCYASGEVCDVLNRIRGPFNMNMAAIEAGAAAIADSAHEAAALAHNARWRPWLAARLQQAGLVVMPSETNFILMRFPTVPGRDAAAADRYLLERGLILRRMEAYNLPDCLRLTVGDEAANRMVADALDAFMQGHVETAHV